jgi:hypothetical protein
MGQADSSPSAFRRRLLQAGALALLSVAASVSLLEHRPIGLRDSGQVFVYAYNVSHHGVFSLDRSDSPNVVPDAMRGPAYPALVALSMSSSKAAREADLECFLDPKGPCAGAQIAAKRINLLILACLVAASFWVACDLCAGSVAPWIVALLVLAGSRAWAGSFSPDPLAALALVVHAGCLYRLASPGRRPWSLGVVAGVSIGVLALTRSMYLYWLILLSVGGPLAFAWPAIRPRLPSPRSVGLLLACGWLIAGGWMLRNAVQTGEWVIGGRGGSVLAVRAQYSTMTGREYAAGYLYFSGALGRPLLERWFEPDDYLRYNALRPRSFKGMARKLYLPLNFPELAAKHDARRRTPLAALPGGAVEAALPPGEPVTEESLRRASWVVIRDHWPMHVALIPLFAVRGAGLLLLLLGGVVIVALRRRAWPVLAFLSPMLFSIAFHAAITHYLARYSVPFIPCAMIALAWWVRPAREPLAQEIGGTESAQPPSLEGGSSLERDRA